MSELHPKMFNFLPSLLSVSTDSKLKTVIPKHIKEDARSSMQSVSNHCGSNSCITQYLPPSYSWELKNLESGDYFGENFSVLWIKHTYTHTKGGNFFLYCLRQSKTLESVLVELNKCYLKFGGEKDPKYKFKMYIYWKFKSG